MSFHEKSNLAMTAIFVLAYGAYFLAVLPPALAGEASITNVTPLLLGAVIFLVIAGVIAHILIAAAAPKDADAADERDRLIETRAEARAGHVLGGFALLAIALALVGQPVFWIAHAVLGGLVAAEIAKGVFRAVDYRRGV
ncbi:MAG: hypothetical protein AAFX09_11025 [Pseudomonadota bacterium]